MKTLIAYYSRTGNNEKLAVEMYKALRCDAERIVCKKSYKGPIGYLSGGFAGAKKKLVDIEKPKKDPSTYDMVIVAAPLWAGLIPPAMRAYLSENNFKIKKLAFVSASGGGEGDKAIADLEDFTGKKLSATLMLSTKDMKSSAYREKAASFAASFGRP